MLSLTSTEGCPWVNRSRPSRCHPSRRPASSANTTRAPTTTSSQPRDGAIGLPFLGEATMAATAKPTVIVTAPSRSRLPSRSSCSRAETGNANINSLRLSGYTRLSGPKARPPPYSTRLCDLKVR